MNIQSYVDQALARENQALNEYESKQVLEAAGLALPEEILALSPGDALAAAGRLGFPVVLKAVGHRLVHKSDRGLVHTGL
ncbi:MAG: acetate--CoA ligase family protein, partial [Desulfobacterales bacterium]